MSFLMGFHDSFTQTRSQLLLVEPIPPINKVFALISQEGHQRNVNTITGTSVSNNPMAFSVKTEGNQSNNSQYSGTGQKKECSLYAYCSFNGHAVDKCYKIHGYPPSYKSKQGLNLQARSHATANQASNSSADHQGNVGDFVQTLNPNQYQHLLAMRILI